jgi:uncharacterized membrane protein
MRTLSLLPPLLLLAACAAEREPFSPVHQVSYSAVGENPFWSLAIGDDAIVLTFGSNSRPGRGALESVRYPRVLPRTVNGVTRWESGEGTAVIAVEAQPGPCTGSRGVRFEDRVVVRLSGRQLNGCGGRILSRGAR